MNVLSYNCYDDCNLHLDDEEIWNGDLLYISVFLADCMHYLNLVACEDEYQISSEYCGG